MSLGAVMLLRFDSLLRHHLFSNDGTTRETDRLARLRMFLSFEFIK